MEWGWGAGSQSEIVGAAGWGAVVTEAGRAGGGGGAEGRCARSGAGALERCRGR
jgi:hypothetical protein